MRYTTIGIILILLAGCTSTREIEVTWGDPATRVEIETVGSQGDGIVEFRNSESLVFDGTRTRQSGGRSARFRGYFTLEDDSIRRAGASHEAVALGRVLSITRYEQGRDALAGMKRGAIVGGTAGVALGLLVGLSMTRDCDPRTFDILCEADAGDVAVGTLATGLAGAFVYGLLGAAIGMKKGTVYRFRPDTPQQMSVVIGVGSANGAQVGRMR